MSRIEVDLARARQQAEQIEEIARILDTLAKNSMAASLAGISSAWQGDNAGMFVRKGDSIATLLTSRKELLSPAADTFCSALSFGSQPPEKEPLIYARVTGEGTFPVE